MLWQKRKLSKSSINNKLTQHSLQANHDMSPPTKSDTDSARVSSCICLTRPALLYGKGSLTVEAAFVVSLFFILVIILISFIDRSEEHTSELQSRFDVVCRLLLEKKSDKSL